MIRTMANGFEQWLQTRPATQAERGALSLDERPNQAAPNQQPLDSLRSWRKRLSPESRRIYSAGRLLFQVIGVAGYAGYFVAMHTLMRFFSGALMAGTWYLIYRIKGPAHP